MLIVHFFRLHFWRRRFCLSKRLYFALWCACIFLVSLSSAHAACSNWRSPQKAWFNEYFFGSGANAPPNFLEVYSVSPGFPAAWQGWSVDVYTSTNTKTTYPLTNATATACTISNKTWLTTNVPSGLRQQNALVLLRDSVGAYVDGFVFDNSSPPAPWPGAATAGWFPDLAQASGCPSLATALTTQAGNSGSVAKQFNMLVLSNYGNKDMARDPDGGPIWDLTSNTGAGTTYTRCVSNNANFTKTVDNATPTPGSTVTFTLSLANTGSSPMSGVEIVDFLPPTLTYISAIPSNPADPGVTTGTYSTTDPNVVGGPTLTATKVTWLPASVAAGTISKLFIKMQVPQDAVEGYTYVNTAQTTAGLTTNQTDYANITIGSPNTPSFAISVSPASATTCTPALLGPKVTITAMSAANGGGTPLTSFSGTVTLSASSPNPKWYMADGSLLSGNTVNMTNGTVTLYLADAVAETFTVSALATLSSDPNDPVMQGSSGNITFSGDSMGIVLTDVDPLMTPSYGAVAGRPHPVRATISSCGTTSTVGGTGTNYSGTIYYVPGLNHPSGATPPMVSTSASCATPVILPLTSSGVPITLNFAAGEATFYLCTADVGQYALNLTMNGIPQGNKTISISGVSPNFTVRPFVITAWNFSGESGVSPPSTNRFTAAGKAFSGTLSAWRWLASADTESSVGNGIPDNDNEATISSITGSGLLTPRFSGMTNNAGVVDLAAVMVDPDSANGTAGTLSPIAVTLVSGNATLNNLSYSEVGVIRIGGANAGGTYAAINYLGAAGLNVPILSHTVGRFVPDHFVVANKSITPACVHTDPAQSFSYMGQAFNLGFTLTAWNAATPAAITKNYKGTFAKLDPTSETAWSGALGTSPSIGLGAVDATNAATTALSSRITRHTATPVMASGWSDGSNTISAPVMLNRAATPDGRFDVLRIGIAPKDSDGVETTGLDLDADGTAPNERVSLGETRLRFGRLKLFNAFGTERSPLNIPVQAQYWSGNSWVLNNADNCTAIPASGVALSNYRDSKGSAGTTWTANPTISSATLTAGTADITLTKSTAAGTGSVDVCVDLASDPTGGKVCSGTSTNLPHLQGRWPPGANYDNDPSATATFGVYSPETRRTVHVRELF